MLPTKLKLQLFDRMSVKTMRYVKSIPRSKATGLVKEVYDMIADETVGVTEEEILPFLQEKGHPALSMDPLIG